MYELEWNNIADKNIRIILHHDKINCWLSMRAEETSNMQVVQDNFALCASLSVENR